MAKYLITFGVGTVHRKKCVIIESDDQMLVRLYVYRRYGQENVSSMYEYDKYKHLIEKYGYEVVEEKVL